MFNSPVHKIVQWKQTSQVRNVFAYADVQKCTNDQKQKTY